MLAGIQAFQHHSFTQGHPCAQSLIETGEKTKEPNRSDWTLKMGGGRKAIEWRLIGSKK